VTAIEVRVQVACFHQGRLLCARHRKGGREYWVLPGGHVDPGERLWEAARRELAEEAGIALAESRLWAVGEYLAPERHVVECTFLAAAWEGEPRIGPEPEGPTATGSLVALDWLDRERFARETFLPPALSRRFREWWDDPSAPADYLAE
jgi:ADP-ribose pyrophosphatase YjhB (NUDIX family)